MIASTRFPHRRMLGAVCAVALSCSFPGVRPEGRVQTVHASAPADAASVFDRARLWFERNGFTIQSESEDRSIEGWKLIQREGAVETRALVEFAIRRATATNTDYSTTYRTVRGVPPRFEEIDHPGVGPPTASAPLESWLSCASAQWPACP